MKIFFAYTTLSSFVKRDLDILKKKQPVVARCIHHRNPIRALGDLTALVRSDLLIFWFASIYSLPLLICARLMRKKVVTMLGGYEAASLPEISYGSARPGYRRMLVRFILRSSDAVVAGSNSSRNEIISNLGLVPDAVGLIYHGFEDIATVSPKAGSQTVLTVGQITRETWLRKGLLDFILTAEKTPAVQFYHAGSVSIDCEAEFQRPLPKNLVFKGRLPDAELVSLMSGSKVYLQLSRHEAFGCSVAESMLCGCIPIVTDAFSLPEVVGDVGIILNSRQPEVVAAAIHKALAMPASEGSRARQRILEHFSCEAREKSIWELLARFE